MHIVFLVKEKCFYRLYNWSQYTDNHVCFDSDVKRHVKTYVLCVLIAHAAMSANGTWLPWEVKTEQAAKLRLHALHKNVAHERVAKMRQS